MWYFNGEPLLEPPEAALGFIYIITNLTNGRKYIGKKKFEFTKTAYRIVKLKNGTKKKKKIKKVAESDWMTYYGSNKELIKDVETVGPHPDNFKREILHFCYSLGEMNYLETKEIMTRDCLLTEEYYNEWVTAKISGAHVKNLKISVDFS